MADEETSSESDQHWVKHRHSCEVSDFVALREKSSDGSWYSSEWFALENLPGFGRRKIPPRFRLRVYPNSWSVKENIPTEYLGLLLEMDDKSLVGDFDQVFVRFNFGVLGRGGDVAMTTNLMEYNFTKKKTTWGLHKCFLFSKIVQRNLVDAAGNLNAICCMSIRQPQIHLLSPEQLKADDVGQFFAQDLFSDVTVVCEDKQFPCHRVVLASRSEVLKAMFANNENKEAKTGQLVIKDSSEETVEAFLKYLYQDQISLTETTDLLDLLEIGDKYGVSRLVMDVSRRLAKKVDVKDACNMLVLALTFELKVLEEAAIKFILENFVEVRATQGWQDLKEKSPAAVDAIVEHKCRGKAK